MVKVVHIINALPKIGGAERLILDIARSRKPLQMKVITWLNTDIGLCDQDSEGVLEVLAIRPVTLAKLRQAKRWIYDADILHVHLFPSLYLAAFFPGPKIYTEHNTWNRRRSHHLLRLLERFVYCRYDHVATISDAVRLALLEWIFSSRVPVTAIDNGISLDRFHSIERTLKQEGNIIRLGMAGSFTAQKNQDFLVCVLAQLPKRVHLVFAGTGPRMKDVEMLADGLGVAERTFFLGNVDDMPVYYNGLDIYIQSSHWEGFGLTVVEAMATGLPCLASDVPGLSEVVGKKNRLFDKSDINQLTAKIKSLITSPIQYHEWSFYSLERAKHFSIDRMVSAYEQLYNAILTARLAA